MKDINGNVNLQQARKRVAQKNGFKTWKLVISEADHKEWIAINKEVQQLIKK